MKDLFGKALLDYQNGNYTEDILTSTSISDEDTLPLPYLFRDYKDMPKLEQKALELCKGHVLDVGCGAGSHSLYLQKKGFQVKAIDISRGAIEVAKQRGVLTTEVRALLDETEPFNTILLLMNGTGIFQELSKVSIYLLFLKRLLKPNGTLVIAVPNFKSYDAQYYKNYWAAYDVPRHLWHFSKTSISKLFHEEQLKLIDVLPMKFDAYYVSLLSEKYKSGVINPIKAFWIGWLSNLRGYRPKEYSSHIYILKQDKIQYRQP